MSYDVPCTSNYYIIKENDKEIKYSTATDVLAYLLFYYIKAGVKMLRDEEWHQEDSLMLKEGKVYVPKDKKLRVEMIRLYHDMPMEDSGRQRSW